MMSTKNAANTAAPPSLKKDPSLVKLEAGDDVHSGSNLSKDEDGQSLTQTSIHSASKQLEMENDSKCMRTSRIVILVSLLITGAIAGGITYYFVKAQEQDQFQDDVSRLCCVVFACIAHSLTFHSLSITVRLFRIQNRRSRAPQVPQLSECHDDQGSHRCLVCQDYHPTLAVSDLSFL
jgi:hypothetical protein